MTMIQATILGVVQGLTELLPVSSGISRSGSTIDGGVFLGLIREASVRYSFLISVPAILGAVVLKSLYFTAIKTQEIIPYLLGFLTAAITGFFSLRLLYFVIRKSRLHYIAYFCWLAGGAVLIFISRV